MTARLILLPDTAAALDRLNDIRELDAKIAKAGRKAAKTGDTSEVHTLNDERAWLAMTLADHLLKGAVYTDSEPDPRVAALEARGKLMQAVVDAVEENGGYNDMHDDVWEALNALTDYDFEQRKRAEAGVQHIMEEASDGE